MDGFASRRLNGPKPTILCGRPENKRACAHVSTVPRPGRVGALADVIFYGIAFVFLGLCLLYVRAADKL